jgi:cytochrome P450
MLLRNITLLGRRSVHAKTLDAMPGFTNEDMPLFMSVGGGGTRLLDFYERGYKTFGSEIIRQNMFGRDMVVAFDPEDFRKVHALEGDYPIGGASLIEPFDRFYKQKGDNNVAFQQGERWKSLRSRLQIDLFKVADAHRYMAPVNVVAERASALIADYGDSMSEFMPRVSFDFMAAVLFGEPIGAVSSAPLEASTESYLNAALKIFTVGERLMSSPHFDEAVWREFSDAMQETHDRGVEAVDAALARNDDATKHSFLGNVMGRIESGDPNALTSDELYTMLSGLLLGGVDTTSVSLLWMLYNLARSPRAQQTLADELHSVLGGASLSEPAIKKLPYLKACSRESFRLTPTVAGTSRVLSVPVVLQGYEVPPGTVILMVPRIHNLDASIFDEPDLFRPERWQRRARGGASSPSSSSIACPRASAANLAMLDKPFSFGSRSCIGARVAQMEIYVLLSRVIQDWRIELHPDSPEPQPMTQLTIRPSPSPRFIFTKRQ